MTIETSFSQTKNLNYDENLPLYATFSFLSSIKIGVLRIIIVGLIIGASIHLSENIIGLSVFISLLTILIVFVADDQIKIYKDKFVYCRNFFFPLFDRTITYYYSELKWIGFEGFYTESLDIFTDTFEIPIVDPTNKIQIISKDGKVRTIDTFIYKSELKKAFSTMYGQLKILQNKNRTTNAQHVA